MDHATPSTAPVSSGATPGPSPRESRLGEILRTTDVGCAACGYNLRGLAPEWRCPECGTRVDRSVASPLLERVDGAWVRRASRGTALVGLGLGAWTATVVVLGAVASALVVILAVRGFTGWRLPLLIVSGVGSVGAGLGVVLVFAGVAMATRPNAGLDGAYSFNLWRRGMLLTLGAWAGAIVVGGAGLLAMRGFGVSARGMDVAADLYVPGVALGSLAVVTVFVGYLGETLTHAPDAGLARRCAWRARMLVLGVLVAIFGFLPANTVLIPLGRPAQGIAWGVAIVAGVAATGFAGWLALGIIGGARRLARCAGGSGDRSFDVAGVAA